MEKLMTGRTYRRRFLLLGGVCLLLLLGSMLVGRYGLSAGKLLHMLWTRLTGGAADWSVSDEKVDVYKRQPTAISLRSWCLRRALPTAYPWRRTCLRKNLPTRRRSKRSLS